METRTVSLRGWFLFVALALGAGVAGVMAAGLFRTQGNPGGLEVYIQPGEVTVEPFPAPGVDLTLFAGETLRLPGVRGRPALVVFWASWCGPCRQEAPALARVWRDYRDRVAFVGVALGDTLSAARRYREEFGLTFPAGLDGQGRVAAAYGVRGVPEKLFVDREGRVVRRFVGPIPEQTLRFLLNDLLAR